jgi:hypothetical protein
MSGIILVVEDLAEEQSKAKEAVMQAGYRAAITGTLEDAFRIWKSLGEKVVGVITDLHFPEKTSDHLDWSDPKKPCGLAVIAEATKRGMPVVVCSNINHHCVDYPQKVIEVFGQFHPAGRIPFVMDSKNWDQACSELQKILEKEVK